MAKYRKKPVVIEAVQFTPDKPLSTLDAPRWLLDGINTGTVYFQGGEKPFATIKTLEGDHRAEPGDWIIRGIKGELYPCKPDIFAATYEPAG